MLCDDEMETGLLHAHTLITQDNLSILAIFIVVVKDVQKFGMKFRTGLLHS